MSRRASPILLGLVAVAVAVVLAGVAWSRWSVLSQLAVGGRRQFAFTVPDSAARRPVHASEWKNDLELARLTAGRWPIEVVEPPLDVLSQ
ncbi:MAG: hypothetical protein ACC645_18340 [Pirellulales bacterium]